MENQIHFTGLLPDNRSEEAKAKDWKTTELVAMGSITPIFRVVQEGEWKKYQVRNQGSSGSCVANTIAKMLEIKRELGKGDSIKFSHAPIYGKRINKPGAGMVGIDALQLAVKYSSCKEVDVPSELLNDAQLDAIILPKNYESLNNLIVPTHYATCPIDFDYMAGMIEKEGAVMMWVNTDFQSWCKDIPSVGGVKGMVVHSITLVDYFNFNGVDYLLIEDSWGKFGKYNGQRLITREFFKDAVWFCAVLYDFVYDLTDEEFAPFSLIMEFGQRNEDISRLQKLLQARSFFPADQSITSFYGPITALAVLQMQLKYNVDTTKNLMSLKGKRVGAKTLLKINAKLLSNV